MRYADICRNYSRTIPVIVELYNNKALFLNIDGKLQLKARSYPGMSDYARALMRELKERNDFMLNLEHYLSMVTLGGGPKIFRPTSAQCFALEAMKLNISVQDFAMPFPTIVVEFPDEYREARNPENHCSQLHYDDKLKLFMHNILQEKTAIKTWWHPNEPDQVIEDWFDYEYEDCIFNHKLPTSRMEFESEALMRRMVINYCLLLDEVGIKREGPVSPNQYAQLVKWCSKKKKNVHTVNNKANMQAHGIVYSLKAETKLVRVVETEAELPEGESGRKVSPHCRRGFYKMQPHGPQNSMRKRIRIPSVVVNAHLLAGVAPLTKEYST